jgi:hypothetical protein
VEVQMLFGDRLGLAGAILTLFALAATILWPDKRWIGWLSLSCAAGLLVLWIRLEVGVDLPDFRFRHPVLFSVFVFIVSGCLAVSLLRLLPIKSTQRDLPQREEKASTTEVKPLATPSVSTPSLVFVFGVPVGDNDSASWVMILKHYGPNTAYNCDIGFYDDDRKNIEHEWLVSHPNVPYPPAGLAGESQKLMRVDEANPEGSIGSFQWNPLDSDSQHYTVSISCRDGVFVEKWEVTRVDGTLRSAITIEHGPQWMKKNPNLSPIVFRYEDPEFIRTALATEVPKTRKGRVVNPGWKPSHRFEVPVAIIDPNNHLQVITAIKLPDGSTVTDFGCWNILTRHFGDNETPSKRP